MYVLEYFYVRYPSTNLCMSHDFSYAQGDLCMSYVQATTSMSSMHQQIQAGMFYVQATSTIFLCIVCINKFVHVPPFFVVQCDICMSCVQATSTIMYVLNYFYVQSASTNLCMFHDFFMNSVISVCPMYRLHQKLCMS